MSDLLIVAQVVRRVVGETGKLKETLVAWWDPTRKKGERLTLYKKEWTIPGRDVKVTYSYRGGGCSGGVQAKTDEDAIKYVESEVVPMQTGKLRRVK